jgi:hypothetical protein
VVNVLQLEESEEIVPLRTQENREGEPMRIERPVRHTGERSSTKRDARSLAVATSGLTRRQTNNGGLSNIGGHQ